LARSLQKYGIDTQNSTAVRGQDIQNKQFGQTLNENKRQYDTDTAENKKTNVINSLISSFNSKIAPQAFGALLAQLGIDVSQIPGLTAETQMTDQERDIAARQHAYMQQHTQQKRIHGRAG
jgi:hypothetical protein